MALTLKNYIEQIKNNLDNCLCLRSFPHELAEKHIKPEIEVYAIDPKCPHLILNPIYLARNDKEVCLIESSVNSCRVSFKIKQIDDLDKLICEKFTKFFQLRANNFGILRKVPVEGYDVSFLITDELLAKYKKEKIIEFITHFIETIDKDLSEIKLNINSQSRVAALFFAKELTQISLKAQQ